MQLDDCCRKLRLVESLNAAGRSLQLSRDSRYGCVDDSEMVAMALPRQSCADSQDGSYGFAAPKLCGHIGMVAKALRCQSSALSSEQARRPQLRLALS